MTSLSRAASSRRWPLRRSPARASTTIPRSGAGISASAFRSGSTRSTAASPRCAASGGLNRQGSPLADPRLAFGHAQSASFALDLDGFGRDARRRLAHGGGVERGRLGGPPGGGGRAAGGGGGAGPILTAT